MNLRALVSDVLNAKFLAFSTPNTKNPPISHVPNAINSGIDLQY